MLEEIRREVCKGKGHITIKIPFDKIAQYKSVMIDDLDEFDAVMQTIIDGFEDDDWLHLFEYGIINKFGYAITYEFADTFGDTPSRRMILLKRPVQPGSNKTLVDDSALSKLFVFGDAYTQEMFGSDHQLAKISVLLNDVAETEDQVRHTDFKPRIIIDDNYDDTDFAVIIPVKVRGNLIIYEYSQHIVHACQKVEDASIDPNRGYGMVAEYLEANEHFKIGVHDCEAQEFFFGTNQALIIGGNVIHGGAKNTMFCKAHKVHFYITKKGRTPPHNQTVVLHNIAWDLTRKGSNAKEIVFANFVTEEQYAQYKQKRGGKLSIVQHVGTAEFAQPKPPAKSSEAVGRSSEAVGRSSEAVAKSSDAVAKSSDAVGRSSEAVAKSSEAVAKSSEAVAKSSDALKRGRPAKVRNRTLADGAKKRGRPPKNI